jgi:hypothetical protein
MSFSKTSEGREQPAQERQQAISRIERYLFNEKLFTIKIKRISSTL